MNDMPHPHPSSAFTLVEIMVSLAITSLLMMMLATSMGTTGRMFGSIANYADLQAYDRKMGNAFSRDVRLARKVKSFDGYTLVLSNANGSDTVYTWEPSSCRVVRTCMGVSTVMLSGCTNFSVSFYSRPPSNAVADFSSPVSLESASPANAGLLEARWTCLRNTNSIIKPLVEAIHTGIVEIRTH
jgi:prepilin-type N-terminal cleavage/methylation domain-containing protein